MKRFSIILCAILLFVGAALANAQMMGRGMDRDYDKPEYEHGEYGHRYGHMGPGMMGYGTGCGFGGGMMGYGFGPGSMCGICGMGQGMMGHGMGPWMMHHRGKKPGSKKSWMHDFDDETMDKFLNATVELRKKMMDKRFQYFEAVRKENTPEEEINKIEDEIFDLQIELMKKSREFRK